MNLKTPDESDCFYHSILPFPQAIYLAKMV